MLVVPFWTLNVSNVDEVFGILLTLRFSAFCVYLLIVVYHLIFDTAALVFVSHVIFVLKYSTFLPTTSLLCINTKLLNKVHNNVVSS